MKNQKILSAQNDYQDLDRYLVEKRIKRIFLVCGKSIHHMRIDGYFKTLPIRMNVEVTRFSDYSPNPKYEAVVEGVKHFNNSASDMIIAVGGGSAIDVAKCIKLYSNMEPGKNYLEQSIIPNDIPFAVMPTTAGTGSEATRFAVIYYKGEKQSVADESCIPDAVLMDASVLETLPSYHKKAAMMDAFCHAIESFWSIFSTDESKEYSRQAIQMIMKNKDAYLLKDAMAGENMLKAANLAGRAINITQTTAGHAMCYKLTSLYGIAHGHAASLCVAALWPFMLKHPELCIDTRGSQYLTATLEAIANAMGCHTAAEAAHKFTKILEELSMGKPNAQKEDYKILDESVNPVRLKNHPISLDKESIDFLYHQILG